jgi:putative ABC transport system permease protein
MIGSYLKTALRALWRHRGTTVINVVGLGVGIAVSVLLLLFIRSELAVNDVFPNAERVARLDSEWADADRGLPFLTTAPAGETMQRQFPEVEAQTRMYGIWVTLGTGTDFYRRDAWLADPTFLDVFDLPLLHGDAETALQAPRTVVLRDDMARTIFGSTDVVGRTVEVKTWRNGPQPYTVTGVWEALPRNSVTRFRDSQYQMILSEAGTWDFTGEEGFTTWESIYIMQYVRLAEDAALDALRAKMDGFVEANAPEALHDALDIVLRPLPDVYLAFNDNQGWQRLYLLAALAALVLLIAGINFTNLATARSLDRTREVGVRKALGAQRGQLARQFLVEAVLVSGMATGLGALAAAGSIDGFAQVVGVEFVLAQPWDGVTFGALAGLALGVGLLAGAYPAFVLSGFQPTAVLTDRLSLGWSAGALRKGLVVVQFAAAIVLMAGVYVVHEQIAFATDQSLAFPADRIVTINSAPRDFSPEGHQRIQTARAQIEALDGVASASVSWTVPSAGASPGSSTAALRRSAWEPDRQVQASSFLWVDAHFADTYDLTMARGRFFETPITDDSTSVVLNETAVETLGLENPVGARIEVDGGTRTVIGVVRNFNQQNVRYGTGPVVLTPLQPGNWYRSVSVKARPGASDVVETVRAAWSEVLPDAPFEHAFLSDAIAGAYDPERQTRRIVGAGAGLALFVALLGLIGLTGFTVQRRTKEIGIRKALGASMARIVVHLSSDIATLVGIAFLVAAPLGYWLADQWLQDFAQRIALTPWPFLAVGFVAMLIALAAVSVHTLRAARTDPARALRSE